MVILHYVIAVMAKSCCILCHCGDGQRPLYTVTLWWWTMVIVHYAIALMDNGHCALFHCGDGKHGPCTCTMSLQWYNGPCTLRHCGDGQWSLYTVSFWWWPIVNVHCAIALMDNGHCTPCHCGECHCSECHCNDTLSLRDNSNCTLWHCGDSQWLLYIYIIYFAELENTLLYIYIYIHVVQVAIL